MRMAQESTSICSSFTSGYSFARQVTTSRHSCEVSSTFALSTLVTFFFRLRGELKRHAGDALNFFYRIRHGVEGRIALASKAARFSEVQSAQQFADEKNVGITQNFRTDRRAVRDGGVGDRRTQVGESAQGFAQSKQARFRTLVRRIRVELGAFLRRRAAQRHSSCRFRSWLVAAENQTVELPTRLSRAR